MRFPPVHGLRPRQPPQNHDIGIFPPHEPAVDQVEQHQAHHRNQESDKVDRSSDEVDGDEKRGETDAGGDAVGQPKPRRRRQLRIVDLLDPGQGYFMFGRRLKGYVWR